MSARVNPIPGHWVVDGLAPDALAAHDAYEAGDPRALQMMVGLPATISIGSDSYAARVVRATRTTLLVAWGRQDDRNAVAYRLTSRGWTYKRHHVLSVGLAEDRRDPSF